MKNLFEEVEKSWNIIFSEFDSNLNKDTINNDLEFKIKKLENSWKNKIQELNSKKDYSLHSFNLKKIKLKKDKFEEMQENDIPKIFNDSLQKIQNHLYFKMYKEIFNLLNLNYKIFKAENSLIWKGIGCSKDFFQILFNFYNFMKSKDFDKIWYLKIIFKELYSLLDKYNIFFSISCSRVNSSDKYFDLFNLKILDKGINKYNYIIIEKYDSINKSVHFRVLNNKALEKIGKDKAWNKVLWNRNRFEHLFLDSALKEINLENDVVLDDLKNSVY